MSREEREEIRQLEATNRELAMRVELLERSAVFFATEPVN
jgi:hypothetical protein